ncbi:MAG TPA: ABC transporter permease, partial [Thermoanaerobaculia bacterium]|nr:ABC transporter permease [Thermoanaerobaculia bacterium]
RAELERNPAVRRTALASGLPIGHLPATMELDRGPGARPRVDFSSVGPGYFELMEIPLAGGRDLDDRDREGAPRVAIVNETFAERFGAAVGETIRIAGSSEPLAIVGIARDSKVVSLTEPAAPFVYLSIAQTRPARVSLLVEGAGEIEGTLAAARELAAAALGGHSIVRSASLAGIVDEDRRLSKIGALLATLAAAAGTLLTALALYAVLATAIARSRRDLAIRVAIGATPASVVRGVAAIAARTIAAGAVPGMVAGWGAATALGPLLGSESMHPIAFAAPLAILLLVAAVAAWGPARRALAVDPVRSLRNV